MLNFKEEIRSCIGTEGMMIYTPNQDQVCIAYENNANSYILKNEPAYLWEGREELFRLTNFEEYTPKETLILAVRLGIELCIAAFFPTMLSKILSGRTMFGLYFLLYSLIFIFEFSIMKGIKRKKSAKGRYMAQLRGALNKALNAFEKKGDVPTFEEIKAASLYRGDRDRFLEPYEILGIICLMVSISFFSPTLWIQIVSIPFVLVLTWIAYKTSIFGVMKLTSVVEPEDYEMKMAGDLVYFWYTISFKDSLQ